MKTNAKTKLLSIFVKIILITLFLLIFNTNYAYSENTLPVHSTNENLKIYSDSVIVIENKTGKVLYEKNCNQKMYPASTTKILTAILAIEKGNLSDKDRLLLI